MSKFRLARAIVNAKIALRRDKYELSLENILKAYSISGSPPSGESVYPELNLLYALALFRVGDISNSKLALEKTLKQIDNARGNSWGLYTVDDMRYMRDYGAIFLEYLAYEEQDGVAERPVNGKLSTNIDIANVHARIRKTFFFPRNAGVV